MMETISEQDKPTVLVKRDKPEVVSSDMLAVFLWQTRSLPPRGVASQLDTRLDGLLNDYVQSGDFSGALNTIAMVRTRGQIQAPRLLLVGLGKAEKFTRDHLCQASATAATTAQKLGATSLALVLPALEMSPEDVGQACTEGALLGLYTLKKYKTVAEQEEDAKGKLQEVVLLATTPALQKAMDTGKERGTILAESVSLARDLANSPGNEVTPTYLAHTAQTIAQQYGLGCRILEKKDMESLQMGCLLGVSQGSAQPPALIILEHAPHGTAEQPVVLIGKGLTFDSGGISIKPAANMEDMKMDMSGGATVLGTMQALARLQYPHRVIGLVPASENLPSSTAVKPGDILRSFAGKTVEVINTDAEGRLVLADALAYAVQEFKPLTMIDLATLTGAVVVALGSHATGMMGTDDAMMGFLREAGEVCGERVWPLPLFEEYSKQIKSDFADLKNVSANREAGSIIGGAFLKEFVATTPWVHLDIAGTAWTKEKKPYIPKGATGVGVRLLITALDKALATFPKPATKTKAKAKAKAS